MSDGQILIALFNVYSFYVSQRRIIELFWFGVVIADF